MNMHILHRTIRLQGNIHTKNRSTGATYQLINIHSFRQLFCFIIHIYLAVHLVFVLN